MPFTKKHAAAAATTLVAGLCGVAYLRSGDSMTCGDGVHLCGVLAIASGLGPGEYAADAPYTHGLWPETDSYGTSDCVAPVSTADPTRVVDCYAETGDNDDDIIDFEVHEWEKHGECAGATTSREFLETVCDLSADPKAVMAASREAGGDLDAMNDAVVAAGYEVFYVDTENMQLYLSACASADHVWKLAAVADFPDVCGDWTDDDGTTVGAPQGRRISAFLSIVGVAALLLLVQACFRKKETEPEGYAALPGKV